MIFSVILWLIWPQISLLEAVIIFLSSFLIDFDHYVSAVYNTGKLGLRSSFEHYEERRKIYLIKKAKGIFMKDHLQIFHTIEFNLLILGLVLIFVWKPLIYAFIGMLFHSVLDIGWMIKTNKIHCREFSFIYWIIKRL
ncbi:MAG: hypothetical protein Q8L29_02015 [archaeon]|nr:hypothetical protein [archaeon]